MTPTAGSNGAFVAPRVYIVDDDPAVRESLRWLLEPTGFDVRLHAGSAGFLADYDPARPACLILDIRLDGENGLDLQAEIAKRGGTLPVIIVSAYGTVNSAVHAMKAGAIEFLEKPVEGRQLIEHVRRAIDLDVSAHQTAAQRDDVMARLAGLTAREREVLRCMLAGKPPRAIAAELGISAKTVDVHRSHVMHKMRAGSMVELTQIASVAGLR